MIGLYACRPSIPDEKLSQIDSLEKVLDSAKIRIETIDTITAFDMAENFETKLLFFQAEMKDTLPRVEANFVDKWYRMRKPMRKFSANYLLFKNELEINIQQMKDLRYDAENGLLEEKHFDEYIALEKDNVSNISSAVHDMVDNYEWVKPQYEKKLPRVDSLIRAYKEIENIE